MVTVSMFGYVFIIVIAYLIGAATAWGFTRAWYINIINVMTVKNQILIDRVRKAESIILNDVLQFTPEDIEILKEKMAKGTNLEEK